MTRFLSIVMAPALLLLAGFAAAEDAPTWSFVMRSSAMLPNIQTGDWVIVGARKGECAGVAPMVGDVVAYKPPQTGKPAVDDLARGAIVMHRVVAGPGDRVSMVKGRLTLNGKKVPVVRTGKRIPLEFEDSKELVEEALPSGRKLLTIGGAEFGYVNNTDDLTVPADHWFVMGDNRDNSLDSRVYGPIPRSAICGVAMDAFTPGEDGEGPTKP